MPTEHIVLLLIQERDKLSRAIEALQGPIKRRGRPPKSPITAVAQSLSNLPVDADKAVLKRKKFSPATRRKMALAQQKRWAAIKSTK